jgi:HhH-GPD superfamily base excision DNA repair protein
VSVAAALADPTGVAYLRKADPVMAQLIDARPGLRPRAWMQELPPLDAFVTLIFQVVGQQPSVSATRTILSRIEQRFGGQLPSPAELLSADPQALGDSGLSARKGATLRALAERFVIASLPDGASAGTVASSPPPGSTLCAPAEWMPHGASRCSATCTKYGGLNGQLLDVVQARSAVMTASA